MPEIKDRITRTKNAFDKLISGLNTVEYKINELKNNSIAFTQTEKNGVSKN